MHKTLVVSGINLVDGGAYSVYRDFLQSLIQSGYSEEYKIIALVSKKELFDEFSGKIELLEFPESKKSWIMRIYYEYFYFYNFSKRKHVNIWISMHDITPRVCSDKQYVYCHNPSPFNHMKLKDIKYGFKYYLFSKFYKFLYRININKNNGVIVQQNWMREEFIKMYHLKNEVIVSRPNLPASVKLDDFSNNEEIIFIYPSFPRYYKNFEVVCEAAMKLEKESQDNFKVYITLDGSENAYSKMLLKKYGSSKNIIFTGLLDRTELYNIYEKSSCLLFMSKLETWGMPITEFKSTGKPMILSDLPYAHETLGSYGQASFVNPNDVNQMSKEMLNVIKNKKLKSSGSVDKIRQPFFKNWNELFTHIL